MVEQAAASAETMRAQAERLTGVVATFRVDAVAAGTAVRTALPAPAHA
jgi:hypothetical protein